MQHCCDCQLAEIFALLKVYREADYLQGYANPESTEEVRWSLILHTEMRETCFCLSLCSSVVQCFYWETQWEYIQSRESSDLVLEPGRIYEAFPE